MKQLKLKSKEVEALGSQLKLRYTLLSSLIQKVYSILKEKK